MDELFGIYPAFVCDVKDPEKRGRIKVTCAEVFCDNTTTSGWCTPITPVGINGGGDFYVPEIDEGVFIMFLEGDIDRPVWIGGWWGKDSTPLGTDYKNPQKTRVISFEDNTIVMKDKLMTVEAGGVELSFASGKLSIKGDLDITGDITVTGDITATGALTASSITMTGDASIGGKSFLQHIHAGVNGNTSAPL